VSYSLNASGHAQDEDAERRLHGELAAVLAKPEYGCSNSYFGGSHVVGTLHEHALPGTEHIHETGEASA
jgi:hypothetical protein